MTDKLQEAIDLHEARGKKAIAENSKDYKERYSREPYFTLTPAGARALRDYLCVKGVAVEQFGGLGWSREIEDLTPQPVAIIQRFFSEKMGLTLSPSKANDSMSEQFYKLMGDACRQFRFDAEKGLDALTIDPVALDALEQKRKRSAAEVTRLLSR